MPLDAAVPESVRGDAFRKVIKSAGKVKLYSVLVNQVIEPRLVVGDDVEVQCSGFRQVHRKCSFSVGGQPAFIQIADQHVIVVEYEYGYGVDVRICDCLGVRNIRIDVNHGCAVLCRTLVFVALARKQQHSGCTYCHQQCRVYNLSDVTKNRHIFILLSYNVIIWGKLSRCSSRLYQC